MNNRYDVVIIGAGTAGLFIARKLALLKHSVIVIEKQNRESCGTKMDQFHMAQSSFQKYNVPPPEKGSDELIATQEGTSNVSPNFKHQNFMNYPIYAMRFKFFVHRLIKLAKEAGVTFEFEAEYQEGIYEENVLRGVKVLKYDVILEYLGKIVIDTSGTAAVVRRSLPENYHVESFEVGDSEKMYVIQRVVQWEDPEQNPTKTEKGISFTYYKTWFAQHFIRNANIFGNGQPGGFQNTEKAFEIFNSVYPVPPYKLLEEHRATTTYRRSPYSLVGDAFVCVGDSACMTEPHSGEGIKCAWGACEIIVETIHNQLILEIPPAFVSRKALWNINVQYFRNQGAKLAGLLSQIPDAANLSAKDVNFLFKKNIIFGSKDFEDMNKHYELKIDGKRMVKIASTFMGGLLRGKITLKATRSMIGSMKFAGVIREHYEQYPDKFLLFPEWKKKADKLWSKVGKMQFTLEE
ncbi:MAG: NAD(P)/FAD-dependent oxidoreductase [Promethearchaeota archaeon]